MQQPDPTNLLQKMELETPLVGFYDAPDTRPFEPLVEPGRAGRVCLFAFYRQWLTGKTLHLSPGRFGCRGAGYWLGGEVSRSREEFVRFLVDEEGLKASHELMNQWLDHNRNYRPAYDHLLIGPLRGDQYDNLKTVTFWVNPDQLSLLILGAQYNSGPHDPPPVMAPFGSGCMQMVTLFQDLRVPQAIIGATDMAMRKHIEPDLLAFTVTKPMFEQLCGLDRKSFLHKRFWKDLRGARSE